MAVSKLVILNLDLQETISTLYNPKEYAISRGVNWSQADGQTRNISAQSFTGGRPRSLSMQITIDTVHTFTGVAYKTPLYERVIDAAENVMTYVKQLDNLTMIIPEISRPPILLVAWGIDSLELYCVLKSVNQTYNMFASDGTPTRANVSLEFEEIDPVFYHIHEENGATGERSKEQAKIIITGTGDNCFTISLKAYGSAVHYKEVARANKVYDLSQKFKPGLVFRCPELKFK